MLSFARVFVVSTCFLISVAGCGRGADNTLSNNYYEPYTISHVKDPLDHEGASLLVISLDSPEILTKLAKYKRLKQLRLEDMNLSAADISDMKPLPMLDLLSLRRCSGLTADVGKVFASKVIAREVWVCAGGRGPDSDPGSEFLATYLQAVDVGRIEYIGDPGNLTWLASIQERPSVHKLDVSHVALYQVDIAHMVTLSGMKKLNLNHCDLSGVRSFAPLLSLKNLTELDLSYSTGAKADLLDEIEEFRKARPEVTIWGP
ncbi:MAG: hypothetical protein IPP14_05035 [Planctomycetes bacterium]|nr:hypothetical protein [Planctomycetota bacterium]